MRIRHVNQCIKRDNSSITSLRIMSFNFRQFEDHATDVDPDLRYMALEDLQKYLSNPKIQARNVASFVPLSFRLLADSVSEVQNQSVHTFPLIIRHVPDSEVLLILEHLYENSERTINDLTFLTSVPHLAIRGIFTESSSRFHSLLAKSVFALLIPRILNGGKLTIDRIEILVDLLRNLGHVLLMDELALLVNSLVDFAFTLSGIVGKRCIVGIDECLSRIEAMEIAQKSGFYDALTTKIVPSVQISQATFFTLTQVILSRAGKSLSIASIDLIFDVIVKALDLKLWGVNLEDLDVDSLIELNRTRETGLLTMSLLTGCISDLHCERLQSIMAVTNKFLDYDPLADQESDDGVEEFSELDSDVDFEDDDIEQFEGTGEDDALAAKLRLGALFNIKSAMQNHPHLVLLLLSASAQEHLCLLIGDKIDYVSDEAVHCCVLALKILTGPCTEFLQLLQHQLFSGLLSQKNILRFSTTILLIEAMIECHSKSLPEAFLFTLCDRFLTFGISLQNFSDIARLYKVMLAKYTVQDVPHELMRIIGDDMDQCLSDPNISHNLLSEVLLILQILYTQSENSPELAHFINTRIFPKILKKVTSRQYPSDLRQAFLLSLTDVILNVLLTTENTSLATEVFLQYFAHEISTDNTIECLVNILTTYPQFLQPQLQKIVLEKAVLYLKSSDSSLYIPSLRLLNFALSPSVAEAIQPTELVHDLKKILLKMVASTSETVLMNACLITLRHTIECIPADEEFFRQLIGSVINIKLIDVDNMNISPLEKFIEAICENNTIGGERMYDLAMQSLVMRNFVSAKLMSILVVKLGLDSEINRAEDELLQIGLHSVETDKIIFDIHFLGSVSSQREIASIQLKDFFAFLNLEDDQVALAAARAIGLFILRDFNHYLPTLLGYYHEEGTSEQKKTLILVAIKQVLKENLSDIQINSLHQVWKHIFDVLLKKEGRLNNKKVPELKLAGDILSKIVELDSKVNYQLQVQEYLDAPENHDNQHLIYTIVVIFKELINKAFFVFDIQNITRIVEFLPIPNIELKLAIISTLLTGIHNKSKEFADIIDDVLMPRIYDELSAKAEFKKVIPMGPYKYNIDDGLEVRKLGYEFISSVVNINNDRIQSEFNSEVDEVRLFEVLCTKGLKDSENEIINATINILIQLMHKDDKILMKVSDLVGATASLTKIANRKLRAKASTQESESYEDTVRNVIRVAKIMNDIIEKNNNAPPEWTVFYYELQNKHQLLFNSL